MQAGQGVRPFPRAVASGRRPPRERSARTLQAAALPSADRPDPCGNETHAMKPSHLTFLVSRLVFAHLSRVVPIWSALTTVDMSALQTNPSTAPGTSRDPALRGVLHMKSAGADRPNMSLRKRSLPKDPWSGGKDDRLRARCRQGMLREAVAVGFLQAPEWRSPSPRLTVGRLPVAEGEARWRERIPCNPIQQCVPGRARSRAAHIAVCGCSPLLRTRQDVLKADYLLPQSPMALSDLCLPRPGTVPARVAEEGASPHPVDDPDVRSSNAAGCQVPRRSRRIRLGRSLITLASDCAWEIIGWSGCRLLAQPSRPGW